MAGKNTEFLNALKNSKFADSAETTRNKALDELLMIDPADASAFRKAVINNKSFWEHLAPGITMLPPGKNNAYYDSNDFLDPANPQNFTVIRQLAVEERVKLGVQKAANDVLVAIMSNNPDTIRAYLAGKPELGNVVKVHGWQENEMLAPATPGVAPIALNKSQEILSDLAISRIKSQAANVLMMRLIDRSEDIGLLDNLANASTSQEVERAAISLAAPLKVSGVWPAALSGEVSEKLKTRIQDLKRQDAKNRFAAHVSTLTEEDFQSQTYEEALQENDLAVFKSRLGEPFKTNLSDLDREWARKILGTRFLNATLANTSQDVLKALNSTNKDQLKTEIKTVLGYRHDYDYLGETIGDDSMASLKKSLFKSFTGTIIDPQSLEKLESSENLIKFRAELNTLGLQSVDWLSDEDLKEAKRQIRKNQFISRVSDRSILGDGAHSELLAAFMTLSVEKQRDLIKKPDDLRHLLNAVSAHVIEHYLGKNIPNISKIIKENQKNISLREINNAAVAKILAEIIPHNLTRQQITGINSALQKNINFSDAGSYNAFVGEVERHCGTQIDSALLRDAFNNKDLKKAIQVQYDCNADLRAEYQHATPGNRRLLDLLLRVEKQKVLQVTGVPPDSITTHLAKALERSSTSKEFIAALHLPPLGTSLSTFTTQLENEVTSMSFQQLKNEAQNMLLSKAASAAELEPALKTITDDLKKLKDARNLIAESRKLFEPLDNISPEDLYNPAAQKKDKHHASNLKASYQLMAEDCDLMVDQLRRNHARIHGHLSSLPAQDRLSSALPIDEKDKITGLRDNLKAELELIKKDLDFYESAQQKLSGTNGILTVLDDLQYARRNYGMNVEGVSRGYADPDNLPPLPGPLPSSVPSTTLDSGSVAQTAKEKGFSLMAKESGKLEYYDIRHKSSASTSHQDAIQTVGRFTCNSSNQALTRTIQGQRVEVPPGQFRVEQFPQQIVPRPKAGSREDMRHEEAKVHFAIKLAATIVSNLGEAPTSKKPLTLRGADPEQVEYLWTALVYMGRNNPKMKFGIDAIEVQSDAFDPKKAQGRYYGFASDSLYASVFDNTSKEYAAVQKIIKDTVDGVTAVSKEKKEHAAVAKAVEPQIIKGAAAIKEQLHAARNEVVKKTIQEEGPAPVAPKTL